MLLCKALSKNPVIYHRGERRVHRVLRLFQSLLGFPSAFAVSMCSAVKFKDVAISLENSTVPPQSPLRAQRVSVGFRSFAYSHLTTHNSHLTPSRHLSVLCELGGK